MSRELPYYQRPKNIVSTSDMHTNSYTGTFHWTGVQKPGIDVIWIKTLLFLTLSARSPRFIRKYFSVVRVNTGHENKLKRTFYCQSNCIRLCRPNHYESEHPLVDFYHREYLFLFITRLDIEEKEKQINIQSRMPGFQWWKACYAGYVWHDNCGNDRTWFCQHVRLILSRTLTHKSPYCWPITGSISGNVARNWPSNGSNKCG